MDSVMCCGSPTFMQVRKARTELRQRRGNATSPETQSCSKFLWRVTPLTWPGTADEEPGVHDDLGDGVATGLPP